MNRTTLPSPGRQIKLRSLVGPSTCALALALSALASAQKAAATPSPTMVTLGMSLPTVLKGATLVSHASSSKVLTMAVSIAPSNRAGLVAFSNAVNDPKSTLYHHFLTPAEVGTRFGAPASTVNSVVSYLKSKGLTVTLTAKNNLSVLVKGTVSNVENAFATTINNYKVASRPTQGPLMFYCPATVPKAPSTFASQVVTIGGLTNANPPVKHSELRPQDARNVYDLTPLYGGTSSLGSHKGENVNIGITNFGGYRLSNAALFAQTFKLPLPGGTGTNIFEIAVDGIDGRSSDPNLEADLDYQMVLGMAPKCKLYLYDGITPDGGDALLDVLTREADDNYVDIVTESYGHRNGDDFYIAAHDLHLAMTAQGITYLCASGDYGADELASVPYPDCDPDVLIVGGTEATLNSAFGRFSEVGWGDGTVDDGASTGGWYTGGLDFNILPPYQMGGVIGIRTDINHRLSPDVALHATEWYMYYSGQLIDIGGTSAATPTFAGQLGIILQALKDQDAVTPTTDGHYRLGRVQDFIYPLDKNADSNAFYDIVANQPTTSTTTAANSGTLPDGTLSIAGKGWDFVTGLGAPDATNLYYAYLAGSDLNVTSVPASTAIYTVSAPTLVLGKLVSGDATSLAATDNVSYSLQSVLQSGVGQVAAVKINFTTQLAKTIHSASTTVVMEMPNSATGTLYAYNNSTKGYDILATVAGTGSMVSTKALIPLNDDGTSPYVDSTTGAVTMLVRSIKPTRLGTTSFILNIDSISVQEKISRF